MPTTILRPNGTAATSGAVGLVGVGTAYGATNDNSDSTYFYLPGGGASVTLNFDDFSQPAGSAIISLTARYRGRSVVSDTSDYVYVLKADGTAAAFYSFTSPDAAIATNVLGAVTGLSDADIDGIKMQFVSPFLVGGGVQFQVMEAYYDVLYATAPAATGTAPTGTYTTTSRPIATWVYAQGTDGGAQTFYRVKVFTSAQYGAGGFDPETSTATYDSGVLVGSATAHQLPSLANGTYRMYVKVAQTINGSAHWATSWAFIGFVINVTTSDVSSVTATPDNTNARILVTVNRNTGSHAWDHVTVQRSVDGGATWADVRTASFASATGNTFTVYDYETGNDQDVTYRAQASWLSSDGYITGAFVQSSLSTGWVSTSVWLKDPSVPANNLAVTVLAPAPDESFPRRQGVYDILGAANPIVRSDVISSARGTIILCTTTLDQATALFTLLQSAVLLLQMPIATSGSCPTPDYGWGSRYIAIGGVDKSRGGRLITSAPREWTFPYVEVDAPADATV